MIVVSNRWKNSRDIPDIGAARKVLPSLDILFCIYDKTHRKVILPTEITSLDGFNVLNCLTSDAPMDMGELEERYQYPGLVPIGDRDVRNLIITLEDIFGNFEYLLIEPKLIIEVSKVHSGIIQDPILGRCWRVIFKGYYSKMQPSEVTAQKM